MVASPDLHLHSKSPTVGGDDAAEAPVSVDSQYAAMGCPAEACLPAARLHGIDLARKVSQTHQYQGPGQFGGSPGRLGCRSVLTRAEHDAMTRACVDVYVRVITALAYEPELRQALEQRLGDGCSLAKQ